MKQLTQQQIGAFRAIVRAHYRKNRRGLPWRQTRDPYKILVSEIMLQQTQVDRVIPKYNEFVRAFPTVRALAAAPLGAVLKAWQGLGYNRRALMLKKAAEAIIEKHGGKVPETAERLDALPGIGLHTAGAICAYAFNQPVVYIETNIRSVFIHHFFHDRTDVDDAELLPLVEQALDRKDPRDWYNALMDYGTFLKQEHPNPARKSAHYARQSRFEGSDRQIRGKIIRLLTQKGPQTASSIYREIQADKARAEQIIAGLTREGMIRRKGNRISL
jgi:A/G-specific adenine glycosylase